MLLIQTDRDTILNPLQAVTGIVERRHTLPILTNVFIERKGNRIFFLTTDLEIQISAFAEADGKGSDQVVTVAARKLQDILRSMPEGTKVAVEVDDKKVQVKAGKSRFNLQTLPAAEFPKLPVDAAETVVVKTTQKALKGLIHLVQYAMAQQDIRYYLNGMLLLVEGNQLKAVATDGHRLSYAGLETEQSLSRQEVILPRKAILELSGLLADSDEPVSVDIGQNQVRFSFGNIVLVSKVIDGKFPDYTRVIPSSYSRKFSISRQQLQQSLQRVSILANEKFKGVRLVLTAGNLAISCTNTDQEEAQEDLEIQYAEDALDIGFNVSYLLDVLGNLQGENIECAFGDANSSALITTGDHKDFRYVVMPMRI